MLINISGRRSTSTKITFGGFPPVMHTSANYMLGTFTETVADASFFMFDCCLLHKFSTDACFAFYESLPMFNSYFLINSWISVPQFVNGLIFLWALFYIAENLSLLSFPPFGYDGQFKKTLILASKHAKARCESLWSGFRGDKQELRCLCCGSRMATPPEWLKIGLSTGSHTTHTDVYSCSRKRTIYRLALAKRAGRNTMTFQGKMKNIFRIGCHSYNFFIQISSVVFFMMQGALWPSFCCARWVCFVKFISIYLNKMPRFSLGV